MTSIVANARSSVAMKIKPAAAPVKSGQLGHRKATPWQFYGFVVLSVIGTIVAIASFVFAAYALGVACVFVALSSGLSAYYKKKLSLAKSLEEYTLALSQKVARLSKSLAALKNANAQLEQVNADLKKLPSELQQSLDKGENELGAKIQTIEELTQKLASAEEKMKLMTQVAATMHSTTDVLTDNLLKFSQENDEFAQKVGGLVHNIEDIKNANKDLLNRLVEVDSETDEFGRFNTAFEKQVSLLNGVFSEMRNLYTEAVSQIQALQTETAGLTVSVQKAEKNAQQLNALNQQFQAMEVRLSKKLEESKAWKKDSKAYQALVQSTTWQNYQLFLQQKNQS